jgi:hypothetical protein
MRKQTVKSLKIAYLILRSRSISITIVKNTTPQGNHETYVGRAIPEPIQQKNYKIPITNNEEKQIPNKLLQCCKRSIKYNKWNRVLIKTSTTENFEGPYVSENYQMN